MSIGTKLVLEVCSHTETVLLFLVRTGDGCGLQGSGIPNADFKEVLFTCVFISLWNANSKESFPPRNLAILAFPPSLHPWFPVAHLGSAYLQITDAVVQVCAAFLYAYRVKIPLENSTFLIFYH